LFDAERRMKIEYLVCIVAVVATLSYSANGEIQETNTMVRDGTCGTFLEWQFVGGPAGYGIRFVGYGEMEDYFSPLLAPWHAYKVGLVFIDIPEGVTSIGNLAFYDLPLLTNVTLPGSLQHIGDFAFSGCSGLTKVVIPENVTSIGSEAFSDCAQLSSVHYFGSKLEENGQKVFDNCSSLNTVCVSPDYEDEEFCGINVDSMKEVCKPFFDMFNACYEAIPFGDDVIQQKRMNVSIWENQTDNCIKYDCKNESGVFLYSKCISTEGENLTCANNQCTKRDSSRVTVVVEMGDGITIEEFNVTSVQDTLKDLCPEVTSAVVVGWETTEESYVIRVILYVEDEDTANVIYKTLTTLDKEKDCHHIFCRMVHVNIFVPDQTLSVSASLASSNHERIASVFAFLLLVLVLIERE